MSTRLAMAVKILLLLAAILFTWTQGAGAQRTTWYKPPPVETVTDPYMVHTSYIQLYEGSTNQPLNWSFSLELDILLFVTLSFDGSFIATIDPSTGSFSVNQGFTSRVNVTWVNGNVTLIIFNVTSADEGVYSCELTGSNSWTRNIRVATVAAASFINVSSDTSLIEGSVLQLFCDASGRPAPNITWVRITSSGSESNVLHRGTTWEFENVSRTEAGTYRCIAYNGVGNSVSHTLRVNVEFPPVIVTALDHIALEGSNLTLFCNATGNPQPDITWTKGDSSVLSSTETLYLINLRREDNGEAYSCKANNSLGFYTVSASITVMFAPEVTVYQCSTPVIEGDNAALGCNVTSNPGPSIEWVFESTGEVISSLLNISRNDGGVYLCIARNIIGNDTKNCTIDVHFPPELTTYPINQTKIEGENVTFTCDATGNPEPIFLWTKDGAPVSLTTLKIIFSSDFKRLFITNVNRTDSGEYVCRATNYIGGYQSNSASLNVYYRPEFIQHPKNQTLTEGDNATFTCDTSGNPSPTLSWTKDGSVVNLTSRISLSLDNTLLVITNVSRGDSGQYICVSANVVGTVQSSRATLNVQSFPRPPENVTVITKTSRVVNMSWTPGFNGNSDILNYTVEISTDNQTFTEARCQGLSSSGCVVSSTFTSASLVDLHPGRTYYIRMFATNKVGVSAVSSVITTTTDEEVPNAPPTKVKGNNVTSTSIFVQWDEVPADNQNGIVVNYTVIYAELPAGDSGKEIVIAPKTNATLTGLKKFTNYSITVFASTAKGGGNKSEPIIVITDEDQPAGAPQNVREHNTSSTSISVSWEPVQADLQNGIITGYNITYQSLTENDNGFVLTGPDDRQANLTGLKEFVDYNISVVAFTVKGDGPPFVLVVRTDQDRPHAPPQNIRANSTTSTSIFVKWDDVPSEDQNGIIRNYTVRYRVVGALGPFNTTKVFTKGANLTGLIKDESYNVSVLATTDKGNGPYSVPIILTTNENKPAGAPQNLRGHNTSSTSISVSWDEVQAELRNGIITGYTILYKSLTENDNGIVPAGPNDRQANLTGLKEFVDYNISVAAFTVKGDGPPSVLVVRTDQDRPHAPPQDVSENSTTSTSIFVKWNDVPSEDQNGIIRSYTVRYRAVGVLGPFDMTTVFTKEVNLTGLIKDESYNVSVLATTEKGDGPYSDPAKFTTNEDLPGAAPSNVRANFTSSTSILVRWDEVPKDKRHGRVRYYTVIWKRAQGADSPETRNVDAPMQQFELTNLAKYAEYSIQVLGATRVGKGPASIPIVQRTDEDIPNAPPSKIQGYILNATNILVQWGSVPPPDQNGIILSYTVTYQALPDGSPRTKVVNIPTTEAKLTGLNPNTNYSITVFASTVKGDGSVSTPIVVLTDLNPIDIYTAITIPENKGIVLNCTKDRFDGKHEWSRKDGEPAVTTTRILTEDTRLNITDASVEDAGEYICRNGQTVTHRFVITVEVFVKVQMIVKVLNYEYTPELQNKSSPAYKATEKNFTAEMDKLYKNTPGYVRTEVLNFTKGSVNVDFRVIIVINAIDPKNASAIPDAKAETTHQVVREAKTGFVKQLQVSPVVEVFSPPLEPRGIEIFEEKSDKLGVRWEPSEDADAFKVQSYHVQYRELLTKIPQNASVPSTEKKDTYSYLIKDLEPKTTYMIRVGAENRHGINFNEERAHKTLAPPFAEWIIVLIVLGILLVTGIIVGLIVFTRRRAEQRRRRLEEEEDGRFGGLSGDVRLASVPNYETRNVKGIKFSFANKSFMPSEANWKEIPYEKITLMNELGSGAFGVVYKGELKQDNGNVTPCAVKTLKESATTEEIRDLYNELEIMTNVGYHPNLVNLLGACTQDGPLLVVIEIAENGNLLELLRKSRETNQNYGNIQGTVLTSDTRLRIAADVAKGMAHLANGRWIHRDLAARNVLLAKNYVAKVADYGMARDIYEQLMYKKETQGKLPIKWMAIESLETYIFTTESDVWSYGVLLWEMESGGLKPYAGLSTTELIDQLKKGYRLEKPDGCSDEVYQIMRDCWNPNPKSRPTFDDLVTRLENMAVSS